MESAQNWQNQKNDHNLLIIHAISPIQSLFMYVIEQRRKFLLRQTPIKLIENAQKLEKPKNDHNTLIFHAISLIQILKC